MSAADSSFNSTNRAHIIFWLARKFLGEGAELIASYGAALANRCACGRAPGTGSYETETNPLAYLSLGTNPRTAPKDNYTIPKAFLQSRSTCLKS